MNSISFGREKILKELVQDIIKNTYEGLNDDDIKNKIISYLTLKNRFEDKQYELTDDENIELNSLNQFFYGSNFGESKNISSSIVDLFKSSYNEVKDILEKENTTGPELISLISGILNIKYSNKKNKDELIIKYLNEIILPSLTGNKLKITNSLPTEIIKSKPGIKITFEDKTIPEEDIVKTKQPSIATAFKNDESDTKRELQLQNQLEKSKKRQEELESRQKQNPGEPQNPGETKETNKGKISRSDRDKQQQQEMEERRKKDEEEKKKEEAKKREDAAKKFNEKNTDIDENDKIKLNLDYDKSKVEKELKITIDDDFNKQFIIFSMNNLEKFLKFYNIHINHYDYIISHLYNLINYNLYHYFDGNDIDKLSVYEEILRILMLYNNDLNYYFLYNFDFFIESIKENFKKIKNSNETNINKEGFIKIIDHNLNIIKEILKYRLNDDDIEFDTNTKKIYETIFKSNYLNTVKFYKKYFTEKNDSTYNEEITIYLKEILKKFNKILNLQIIPKVSKGDYKDLFSNILTETKIFENMPDFSRLEKTGGANLDYCFISFMEIYKLYYNCISFKNGNLIFKNIFDNKENYIIYFFYLFFNAYSYYFKDNKEEHNLIDEIKFIIKNNNYSEQILLNINNLIIKIFDNIYKLFDEYITEFNDIDSIIQNYYIDKKQKLYYLFINFIYPFYININKKDLNFTLSINETLIKINKTYDEIILEINELLYNEEFINYIYTYLVKKLTVKILNTNDYLKPEIEYLIKFIYYYTSSKNKIILTSLYEINAYIILKLLTSSETITLNINGINYNFPSSLTNIIKNHPYIFEFKDKDDLKVEIKISKTQEELYKCILDEKNVKQILLILTEDFSYLNLDLKKNIKFKFYLNKEIINFIHDKTNNFTNNSLINYGAYNFSLKSTHNPNLKIFNVIIDKKYYKLLFSINYATFLCSSLYKKINLYNYSTLIYLFIYIKYQIEHKTKEYLEIINYNGPNDILNKYKNLLKTNNLLDFLKIVIILMQINLSNKYDLNTFIYYLLNFSQNKYVNKLKSKIYIDINFITELFKNKNQPTDINFYTFLLNLSTILYESCILNNFNEKKEVIELMYNFFIPILKELYKYSEHITITKLEKYVIDIRALELSNMICKKKLIGGNGDKDNFTSSIQETKNEEELNMEEIENKLSFLNKFKKDYEKFDIKELKEAIKSKFEDYLKIPKFDNKKGKDDYDYISNSNYSEILPPINNPEFLNKITDLVSAIKINKSKIIKELKKYNIFIEINNDPKEKPNDDIYNTKKIEEELKTFTEYLSLLEKYKSNKVVGKIISHFYKKNTKKEDDKEETDENNKIIKDIELYISEYKNIIDKYIEILQESLEKYDILSESIKKTEQAFRDENLKYKRDDRNIVQRNGGYYNNFLKGGDFKNNKINDLVKNDDLEDTNYKEIIKNKETTKNKIDAIIKDVKKLKANNVILNSIDKEVAATNFIDDNGDNLFEKMLNSYNNDIKTTIPEIAENKFYNDVLENDLDPEIELALTFNDKIIFIVVIFLLRLASLYITYYFIDNNVIFGIVNALYYYIIAYLIVFVIVLITINIDAFKLRILLNYFNMHINSSNIYTHVILKLIIGYIVYLLIINLNMDPDPTRLSKNQKIKLKYKLDILTMIVLIFIITFTLII